MGRRVVRLSFCRSVGRMSGIIFCLLSRVFGFVRALSVLMWVLGRRCAVWRVSGAGLTGSVDLLFGLKLNERQYVQTISHSRRRYFIKLCNQTRVHSHQRLRMNYQSQLTTTPTLVDPEPLNNLHTSHIPDHQHLSLSRKAIQERIT